jgi:4-diphosphocytidyl-2-C-methyl-D-erythritol kinase
MTRTLRLPAPAKLNWTLEVLHIRPDGYHEIRSVLQTLDLADSVTLREASDIEIDVRGAPELADLPPEENLAYRAALALRERMGRRARGRGVRIELEKRIPVAAGLGGGSSDAAAVVRGLNVLWDAGESLQNLIEVAGEVGSDPPFLVAGGTAMVGGRGEAVEPLLDAVAPPLLLAIPPPSQRPEKTAAMYDALTPDHFSEGYVSIGVREIVVARREIVDDDLNNVFEHVTSAMQPDTGNAMDALRAQGLTPHLAGAGPSFYLLLPDASQAGAVSRRVRQLGFEPRVTHILGRAAATRIEEL